MYSLISYVQLIGYGKKPIKRVLLSGGDPTHYLTGMNKLCYPIAISPLTKRQFDQMADAFPTIEVIHIR